MWLPISQQGCFPASHTFFCFPHFQQRQKENPAWRGLELLGTRACVQKNSTNCSWLAFIKFEVMLLCATPTPSALKLLAQRRQLHTINTALWSPPSKLPVGVTGLVLHVCICVWDKVMCGICHRNSLWLQCCAAWWVNAELMCHSLTPQGMSFNHSRPADTEGGLTWSRIWRTTNERYSGQLLIFERVYKMGWSKGRFWCKQFYKWSRPGCTFQYTAVQFRFLVPQSQFLYVSCPIVETKARKW